MMRITCSTTFCASCHQPLPQPAQPQGTLTAREIEVLEQVARGYTNREICSVLGMRKQTLKNEITAILRKLQVRNRTAAVICALKYRWIALPEEIHETSGD